MPKTPTTPASVASRLSDDEIECLARITEDDGVLYSKDAEDAAAVLRDYVRLRNLANAVKEKVKSVKWNSLSDPTDAEMQRLLTMRSKAINDISFLLEEAEKGEAE